MVSKYCIRKCVCAPLANHSHKADGTTHYYARRVDVLDDMFIIIVLVFMIIDDFLATDSSRRRAGLLPRPDHK